MFKRLIAGLAITAAALAAVPVYAKGGSSSPTFTSGGGSGVITPDVATGFTFTRRWTTSNVGTIVICPDTADYNSDDNTCIEKRLNRWQNMASFVPVGRTFAGFQLIPHTYSIYLVVYWK